MKGIAEVTQVMLVRIANQTPVFLMVTQRNRYNVISNFE